eukprot:Amastigsp_a679635_16.p3 type:complete len:174 gc:universal Amastigsp_a679635_16:1057-536(-)
MHPNAAASRGPQKNGAHQQPKVPHRAAVGHRQLLQRDTPVELRGARRSPPRLAIRKPVLLVGLGAHKHRGEDCTVGPQPSSVRESNPKRRAVAIQGRDRVTAALLDESVDAPCSTDDKRALLGVLWRTKTCNLEADRGPRPQLGRDDSCELESLGQPCHRAEMNARVEPRVER